MQASSTTTNSGAPTKDVPGTCCANRNDLPHRVRLRPSPDMWSDDELMTLAEAASLFWPLGPLTTTSLRTAVRDKKLEIAEVAGKLLTNKASIVKMCVCRPRSEQPTDVEEKPIEEIEAFSPRSAAEYSRMRKAGVFKRR